MNRYLVALKNYAGFSGRAKRKELWFKLIFLVDKANRIIKEIDLSEHDKNNFYKLKDEFLEFLVKNKSDFIQISFSYVPYFKYCRDTKDKADALMRKDNNKKYFGYYLSQIEPSVNDIEIKDKATIELEVLIKDTNFSFHIPYFKTLHWNLDINSIPKKAWVSDRKYKEELIKDLYAEINTLFNSLK